MKDWREEVKEVGGKTGKREVSSLRPEVFFKADNPGLPTMQQNESRKNREISYKGGRRKEKLRKLA